ncbi:MAG: hypothetical protein KC457_04685, partial [Myxococcales bacterium]|nr:hypothetical protein [Myxococcales bacterium]
MASRAALVMLALVSAACGELAAEESSSSGSSDDVDGSGSESGDSTDAPGETNGSTGEPPAQGSLVGWVDDIDGVPIPDLPIALCGQVCQIATTDAEGRFEVLEVAPGAKVLEPALVPVGDEGLAQAVISWTRFFDIVTLGEDAELDKTMVDALSDPLMHMIRNAIDHGIEHPAERVARGKPRAGRIVLSAYQKGNRVVIELTDDGQGMDWRRIRDKAVERGFLGRDESNDISPAQAINLIFTPGFSTRETATELSGRGVGMDVVKTNVEQIGGSLDIQSKSGHGTTLRIKIPLTLAIVPALIVRTGGDQYAIPQVSLLELVRLDGARAAQEIEFIHDVPVYRLRGDLLP